MADWAVVTAVTVGYLVLTAAVGLISGSRASATTEGWVAGDRTLGFVVLYFIMGASIFSAFAFLGGPGWAYSRGAAAFYILAYGVVGLVPWYFVGPRVAELGRRHGYVTQAEFFAHRFRSPALSAVLAVVSVVALLPYLTLQMEGAGYVLEVVTEGRVPAWAGAGAAYAVVLLYVFRSGVMGVGWTNTMQGIFMMALAWGLGLWLPHELYGGVGPMFDALAEARPELLRAPGLGPDGEPWSWGGYTSAVAISVLGFSVWPHYFQKLFTARDDRTIRKTVVFYPTFLIFLVPILFIGFSGVLAFPGVEPADAILPTVITSLDVPAAAVGLFCAGALAASMSTGDAILHTGASILVRDLWEPLADPELDPERERRSIRALVVVLGAAAYYLAVLSDASLVALLLLSYGFVAQLFPLLAAAFFWPRATPAGALAGLAAGGAVTVLFNLAPSLQWADIHPGLWGLAANAAALVAVSLATEPMDEGHVREFVVS